MVEPPVSSLFLFFFFFRRSLLRILSEKKKLDQTPGLVFRRRISSRAAAVASIQLAGFVYFLSLFVGIPPIAVHAVLPSILADVVVCRMVHVASMFVGSPAFVVNMVIRHHAHPL